MRLTFNIKGALAGLLPCLLIVLFSVDAEALTTEASVYSVERDFLLLSNGRVAFFSSDKKSLPSDLQNKDVKVVLDSESSITELEVLKDDRTDSSETASAEEFEATVLPGMEEAHDVFNRMRQDYQEQSQCYNNAHVWAYEEHKKSGLNSMKMFLFFTRRYIRKYKFHWWFHVSPMVFVKTSNEPERIILDRRYASIPLDLKTWTDQFMINKAACKEVDTFKSYWTRQKTEDCYLIPVSMYFWQPRDIRARDSGKYVKKNFRRRDIRRAYEEAY